MLNLWLITSDYLDNSAFDLSNFDANTQVELKLFNLEGQEVIRINDLPEHLINQLKRNQYHLPTALYLANISSLDGQINLAEKIFIGN